MRLRTLVPSLPAFAAIVLLTAGCADTTTVRGAGDATRTAVAAEPPAQRQLRFGEHFDAPDGIGLTLSPPVPYAPSTDALTDGSPRYVRLTLTIANHSDGPLAPETLLVKAWAGHRELRKVVDGAKDVGQARPDALGSGDSASKKLAFGLPRGHTALAVRVDPSGGTLPAGSVRYIGSA